MDAYHSDFNRDDAADFLQRKGAEKPPCLACGENRWIIAEGIAVIPAPDEGGFVRLGGPAHVVPVVCQNCGFTRLHDWAFLKD